LRHGEVLETKGGPEVLAIDDRDIACRVSSVKQMEQFVSVDASVRSVHEIPLIPSFAPHTEGGQLGGGVSHCLPLKYWLNLRSKVDTNAS
jgi:hypothetical protein